MVQIDTRSEIRELLKEKGVKPTVHRVEILEYLRNTYSHPSADEIYEHFVREQKLSVLSRATVYNTLRALADAGLVKVIITPDAIRYDFVRENHHHFYCTKCKKIYDIELNVELPNISNIDGHEVHNVQLTLVGICKNCLGH
ncbi:Fur family transcriptional regulator, peroxide stress response regulator [Fervidobacterium changbaicum]|uniref:Transcriptional repressor n=2 Tax=Fervidobacterium TaxID=2422 RepID=A0AAI8CKN5_FERIS|nr:MULTISPECIES: transcriptional repressor [Fervidobacterium]AMW32343.1 transcriptional repressor [Fervidobacterium islandicum]QAV32308.1 transcriptional repressor [Fervidobacterium changbaicum]QAV34071.1 transcriptional repressor [Fervidobacterium changbaicum]SDH23018.1 Fur family transcriptional regulator, peroxide stress response regulator [Fervidobacterium changbaicum]